MAKELHNLKWLEELLPEDCLRRSMFGGFAYYLGGKLVLVIFESQERVDPNWDGCLVPTERKFHSKILGKYPQLFPHRILSKWLYLPVQTESFESLAEQIVSEIRKRSPLFGILPPLKKTM